MFTCGLCKVSCNHIFDNCGCECLCSQPSMAAVRQETTVSVDEYKQFIYDSLALAENCGLPDGFMDNIDCWWSLYSQRTCGNEMLYLMVRRESLKYLLACNAWQIDRSTSVSTNDSRTDGKTRQESESQAQQNNFSSNYSDSIGQARYADRATSILRAESQRTAHSETHDVSERDMDDEGIGDGYSNTDADRRSRTIRESREESESGATMSRYGSKAGGEYQFSQSQTRGNAVTLGFGAFGRTGTKSASDTRIRSDSSDNSYESRRGTSDRRVMAESAGWSNSARISSSFFQNDILDNAWGTSDAEAHDHSRSQSDQSSEATGKGQSATNARGRGMSSSQATEQTTAEGNSLTEGQSLSQSVYDFAANSQRFDHLLTLYEANNMMITLLRARLRTQHGYAIGRMIFGNTFGLCGADVFGGPIEARLQIRHGCVNGIVCPPEKPPTIINHKVAANNDKTICG